MAITRGTDGNKQYIIRIQSEAGDQFRTIGGSSGGKCAKAKGASEAVFVSADDYRYASQASFLDSVTMEKQVFFGGGAVEAKFCDLSEEE